MKLAVLLFLLLGVNIAFSQSFTLSDTSFVEGDIYRPDTSIYFDYDSPQILPRSYYQIDLVVEFLEKNTELIMEVGVHRDTRGSARYSRCLDCVRARSVKQYLINKGIPENRLQDKGYGESRPIISDAEIAKLKTVREKEEAHATNRRVEFKIVGFIE